MTQNLSSPSPIQPLSIGNVVTAGLRLYRSHLKSYFQLALKAYAWGLVPVYGWAKFLALSGLLSRLAFSELVSQPESVTAGRRYVNSKLWQFLITLLLISVLFGAVIGIFAVLTVALIGLITSLNTAGNGIAVAVVGLIIMLASIAFFVGFFWLIIRFWLVEVTLAIEDDVNASSTIGRTWELTKGYVWRISAIFLVASLITLPLGIAVQVTRSIIQVISNSFLKDSPLVILSFVLTLGLSLLSSAVVLPFWQAIKAVIYYDLRTRREGLGLNLRDRKI